MGTFNMIWRFAARKEIIAVVAISFIAGFLLRGGGENKDGGSDVHVHDAVSENAVKFWTCSMHPQIRQPGPGQCPICGMDLIPVSSQTGGDDLSPRQIALSPAAAKLAGIRTAPVDRRFVTKELRMAGKVAYDETGIGYITAWLPGRIDRLYVDYTGIPVRKGDHLADIYSPALYTTQQELIQALKAAEELKTSELSTVRETALGTVAASREKLRLLGLTDDQIAEFETLGEPADHVTIYSPSGGVVIHKNAAEGIYVSTGTKIYTIADLSTVWVLLDVYESDLAWIRYGQEVTFQTEAYPGGTFAGKIAFIDPLLNDATRTVKVRINVPNTDGRLKPDMFVRAIVHSQVASGGRVMDQSLAGKFICPMHPEIVKNAPGSCDICGMALEKAESLGYAGVSSDEPPLVIPASAPLVTGKRAVVYVAVPDREGVFEGKEIVLGPRAGDHYIVEAGLAEGEMVVVNGNFKIDSAVQILAKPSMMSPEGGVAPASHHHGGAQPVMAAENHQNHEQAHGSAGQEPENDTEKHYDTSDAFKKQLVPVFGAYFHIRKALSHDSADNARKGAGHLRETLAAVDMTLVTGDAHMAWMKALKTLKENAKNISESKDIETARNGFIHMSHAMITVAETLGTPEGAGVYRFHCPMADGGKGADWLQYTSEIENPFYGSSMLKCGELVKTLSEPAK